MPRPPAADLHRDLARAIVDYLRASGAEPGIPLSETILAKAVGTSRTPLRGALPILLELEVLERCPNGRLRLQRLPGAGEEIGAADGEAGDAEELYWRVARDRIGGALPDVLGEAELMRRYGAPRGIVHRVLLQIMGEGWIERAPAGNWRFLALIDGPESYDESYRFRRAIEPAALLDPAFSMPPLILARLRREQQGLLKDPNSATPREAFELNSGFHLALTQASNNRFFADAGLRVTRLRRVVGYVIALDRGRLATQSAEHLAILEHIEARDREKAAELLVRHLDAGRASKAKLLEKVQLQALGLASMQGDGTATSISTSPPDQAA